MVIMEKVKRDTVDVNTKSLGQAMVPTKDKKPKVVLDDPRIMNTHVLTDVGLIAVVHIDTVNPYDSSHFPWDDVRWDGVDKMAMEHNEEAWTKKYHQEGTNLLKKEIEKGFIVRPLLVFNGFRREHMLLAKDLVDWEKIRFQRLDGFKRYMALKELGYTWIIVQIVGTWVGGAQINQPWVL